jgi:hypothetical protein
LTQPWAIRGHYPEHDGRVPAVSAIVGYSHYDLPYDLNDDPAGPLLPVERLRDPHWAPNRGLTGLTRIGLEMRQSRSSGDWLGALDGSDFWDSSSIDLIGLGPWCTSLSGLVGRTFCDTPTSQSTASGRILWCVREYLHVSCRDACSARRNRGQAIVGRSATGSLD